MKCKTCGQEIVENIIQEIPAKTLEWGKTCEKELNWEEAKDWCSKQGEGWRLPTLIELQEAYEDKKIRGSFQPNGNYWSSTEFSASNAYYVYFYYGGTSVNGKANAYSYVRCVR